MSAGRRQLAISLCFGYREIMVKFYTHVERKAHLTKLKKALERLCTHLEKTGLFPEALNVYKTSKTDVELMFITAFSQSDLSKLSRSIPDLYNRHKDWQRPLEKTEVGFREPDWFKELETYLQPVLQNARLLREIGHY